jgi:FMN phosphatase YigB (HAD superfamily)
MGCARAGQHLDELRRSPLRLARHTRAHVVDLFVLSFEHGVQKLQPEMFQIALEGLNLPASQVLMVGDRAAYDGAAVGEGMVTLLLPTLRSITDCRLHLVTALLG